MKELKDCNVNFENDHPVEDIMGDEIQVDDVYYKIGNDIVLEENLKVYLISNHKVECYQAQK